MLCSTASASKHLSVSLWSVSAVAVVLPCVVKLDGKNAVFAGNSVHLLKRLQWVINSAAWLDLSWLKFDHLTPLLHQLRCLTALWRINFKLVVLACKCLHSLAPSYLADELHHPAKTQFISSFVSPPYPIVNCGIRAFPIAAARVWKSLPLHITNASTLSIFCIRLKTYYYIFVIHGTFVGACEVTLSLWTR